MHIETETYSPATYSEELDALTADFISYKRDGVLPIYWSRCTLRRLVYLAINRI